MLHYQMNEHGFQTKTAYGDLQLSKQNEHGYRPYELMVSSIASCSGFALQLVLEKMRLTFTDIQVTTNIERNLDHANRIEEMDLTYTVVGTDATDKQLARALKLAIKNCGMIQSVKNSITFTETIKKG